MPGIEYRAQITEEDNLIAITKFEDDYSVSHNVWEEAAVEPEFIEIPEPCRYLTSAKSYTASTERRALDSLLEQTKKSKIALSNQLVDDRAALAESEAKLLELEESVTLIERVQTLIPA